MFCDSPASATEAKSANYHPRPQHSNYIRSLPGHSGLPFLSCSLFLTFSSCYIYGSRQVARLMATTSFGISARRAEQCVLSSDCFLFLCFGYDQVTELHLLLMLAITHVLQNSPFFIVIFPLRLCVIGIAGEQAAFLYRRGRLALNHAKYFNDMASQVCRYIPFDYDCVFIKPKCVYGKMGLSYYYIFCFAHTSTSEWIQT
jgi:hypothetical protein